MTFNLVLNSKNVVGNNNNTYQFNFSQGSFTIPEDSYMSISQITLPYSFINVSSALGNNTFQYYIPTGATGTQTAYTVLLADGFYTVKDIQNQLWATMKANGHYFYNITSPYSAVNPQIIYPLSISINITLYTTQIISYLIPLSANVASIFGTNFSPANGSNGTISWVGTYPAGTYAGNSCPYIVIPTTTISSSTIGNILGFVGGSYPSTNTGLSTSIYSYNVNGNSLTSNPPFPALGSNINGIVARCNLVENNVQYPNDCLDSFAITSTYGSNINYLPVKSNWIKIKSGKFSNLTITFNDQNFKPLICLDNNVLITLLIKFPKKK